MIERYEGANNLVFIDYQLKFTVGKKAISVRAIDRIFIKNGLIKKRAVYFNT